MKELNRKQTEFMPRNLFYASQIPKARISAILTCKGGELYIIGGQIRIDMKRL